MLHRRHYEVIEFDKPIKEMFSEKVFKYGLTETKDGNTKLYDTWYHFETKEAAQEKANEFNTHYYLTDFDITEVKDWFTNIDWSPVFNKLNNLVDLDLTYKVVYNAQSKNGICEYFEITSNEDITDLDSPVSYFLRAAWRSFKVQTFNTGIYINQNTGELSLWGNFDFRYTHNNGGSNGAHILDFNYNNKDGWRLISCKD